MAISSVLKYIKLARAKQVGLSSHVYGFCRPAAVGELSAMISGCTTAVASWTTSNSLKLNADKTEVMWCTTGRCQHNFPSGTMMIDGNPVSASSSVRDLGIHSDADLVMRTHVQKTVSRCFSALCQLRQIRRSVPQPTLQSLVVTLVKSRLDYGNCILDRPPSLSYASSAVCS